MFKSIAGIIALICVAGAAAGQSRKGVDLTHLPTAVPSAKAQTVTSADYYCEKILNSDRIVGGRMSSPDQWPGFLSIIQDGTPSCAATLIERDWALTAAHCVVDEEGLTDWSQRFVSPDWLDEDSYIKVEQIIVNPSYARASQLLQEEGLDTGYTSLFGDDVALLKLADGVYGQSIVTLAQQGMLGTPKPGDCLDIVGWGTTKELSDNATRQDMIEAFPIGLMHARLPFRNPMECGEMGAGHLGELSKIICAGYPQGGRDTCQGDSGGPIYSENAVSGELIQVGVVSWGEGCGRKNRPGIYARTSAYSAWIEQAIALIDQADSDVEIGLQTYEEGNLIVAEAAFSRALSTRKEVLGHDTWPTNDARYFLGITHFELGQYRAAKTLFLHTFVYESERFEARDPQLATTMKYLALTHLALNEPIPALTLLEEALASDRIHNPQLVAQTQSWIHEVQ